MRMRARALPCTSRGKSQPGGRMLVAGIEEHQRQQGERGAAGGNGKKCLAVSPPHLPSTFDIYSVTFNVKRASAGSKKAPPPTFLCCFIPHFSQHASLPVHKLSSAPHLSAAVGDAAVAHEAQTPSFHRPRAALSASDPLWCSS